MSSVARLVLLLIILSRIDAKLSDVPFDQESPFLFVFSDVEESPSKAFERLPFSSHSSIIPLPQCFIALDVPTGTLYSSSRDHTADKLKVQNPYHGFETFYKIDNDGYLLHANGDYNHKQAVEDDEATFYIVASNNILEVVVDANSCKKIISTQLLLDSAMIGEWGVDVSSITSSSNKIFLSVNDKADIITVDLDTGHIGAIKYALKTVEYSPVICLYYVNEWERLYVSTNTTFYTLDENGRYIYHEWIEGVLDTPPVDMSFDNANQKLWLAEKDAVHRVKKDGTIDRFGYHQGNPLVTNISSCVVAGGYVWVGSSSSGVSRVNADENPTIDDTLHLSTLSSLSSASSCISQEQKNNDDNDPWKWKYFGTNRYLVDNSVRAVLNAGLVGPLKNERSNDNHDNFVTTMMISNLGISLIEVQRWTLQEKSTSYLRADPRHQRRGLLSAYGLNSYGDVRDGYQRVDDNDGLWTSMHAVGESYAFAVDQNEADRARAWAAFEGLEALNNVTGSYPTFPARSYCYIPDNTQGCGSADGDDRWHLSTTMNDFYWKDDTSSDEIDGHLMALPVIYDLVARTQEEKDRVYNLIEGITGGIVENDLYLIDPTTGKRTLWGFWNPKELNYLREHYSERPTNSLGILAYLASAYSVTKKDLYKRKFYELVQKFQYVRNCLNEKIDNPDDDNHSDNELISITYHILFYAWYRLPGSTEEEIMFKNELKEMSELLVPSALKVWKLIGGEFNPLWTSIYLGLIGLKDRVESADLYIERSVHTLRRNALDLINWPVDHSIRADITITPFHVRDHEQTTIREVLPPDQRPTTHFNANLFAASTGSGMQEYEPSVFRLPYYMMRFYGLLN